MIDNESSMGSLFSQGRVAQQDNRDPGITFNLPKEVIQERENVWSNFFDKYANEVPNDVELNISTMEPVGNETNKDEEEGVEEDDEEDNDDDNKEYYSKCRAPIRKLPALIQYWVDTGNPPYQLTGDEDHSDTGSSLSEGDYSRSNQSAALRKSIEDPKFDENSPYSSVDTAAYVLSNANVTKKAKTQEIVEGAKRSNEELCAKVAAPIQENPNSSIVTEKDSKQSDNRPSNEIPKTPPKGVPLNCMTTPGGSVMLCEVLPALQQFDDLLQKSKQLKQPRSVPLKVRRSRRKPAVAKSKVEKTADSLVVLQPMQKSMESNNDSRGTANFRKLYTGRDSPCDLIMTENTSILLTPGRVSHPALEPVPTTNTKTFVSRARTKRKRKRSLPQPTTMSERLRCGVRNSSQENRELVLDDKNNNNNTGKEGHERYTEFFESLGLTPKKTSMDNKDGTNESRLGMRRNCRRRINIRTTRTTCQSKSKEPVESSIKETQRSLSQDLEPRDRSPKIAPISTDKVTEILGKKILSVRITRLSDEVLARYGRQKSKPPVKWFNSLSYHDNPNIELLTTATNDSDSSTILIYSCGQDDNEQCYDSDCSSFQKMLSLPISDPENDGENEDSRKEQSSLSDKQIFATKTTESSSVESSQITPELLENNKSRSVVRLEILPLNQQPSVIPPKMESNVEPRDLRARNLNATTPKIKADFQPKPRDSRAKNLDNSLLSPLNPMENGTRGVTPGLRRRGKSEKIEKLKTDENDGFSFGFNFRTSSEADEDCFARLIQESSSSPHKNGEKSKKSGIVMRQEILKEGMNDELEINVETIRKPHLGVATSSDEEEDDRVTFSRKFPLKQSPRKIDTKITHEAPKGSKNRRKVIDEIKNDDKISVESENLDKSGREKERADASTENRENNNLRRSGKEKKNLSEELSNCAKIVDFRKKAKLGDFTEMNLNFGLGKKKRLEQESPRDSKKLKVTRALKFCTRLSSDSDSHFGSVAETQKLVGTNNKKSMKDKPILPKANPVNEPKKLFKKWKNIKESEKKSLANFHDKFTKADEKLDQNSRRFVVDHNSTSPNSRKKMGTLPSRSKNNIKTRARETATKKVRRSRILRTRIQYETDDDDSEQARIILSKSTEQNLAINEKTSKRSKDGNNESMSPEKRQDYLQNFFPDILEDSIQDIDNIFTSNENSQQKSNNKNPTKLVKPIVNKRLINARKSTITFRTKLTSDSDNETDL